MWPTCDHMWPTCVVSISHVYSHLSNIFTCETYVWSCKHMWISCVPHVTHMSRHVATCEAHVGCYLLTLCSHVKWTCEIGTTRNIHMWILCDLSVRVRHLLSVPLSCILVGPILLFRFPKTYVSRHEFSLLPELFRVWRLFAKLKSSSVENSFAFAQNFNFSWKNTICFLVRALQLLQIKTSKVSAVL